MNNSANLLHSLIEKMNDEPTSGQALGILADMAGIIESAAEKEYTPIDTLDCYLYLGHHYYYYKHYMFALTYYDKALIALEQCAGSIAADDELRRELEECFVNMFDMYKKMDKEKEAKELAAFIKKIMPSLLEAVKKARRSHLKNDPVEYTEAYMAILPELELKIDAELQGVNRGHGFCFQRWHTKAEILKRDYGIEWDSPGVLNPHVRFD